MNRRMSSQILVNDLADDTGNVVMNFDIETSMKNRGHASNTTSQF